MSQSLEHHIVELLKEGDERALSLLYDHYSEALYGVAYKITNNEIMAQDVLQESFIKVWKKADTYSSEKARLFTWLFRITRNTAIDKLRSRKVKDEKEIQMEVSDVYKVGTNSYKPELMDIADHVNGLEEKYQIVLDALFFRGMTQQEASEALDVPLGTVKSRLKIGLRELRKVFGAQLTVWIFIFTVL